MYQSLSNFSKLAVLRPYGKYLLTPAASVWFLFMAFLVSIMAIVEGATWGIISTYVIPDPYKMAAVFVGLIIFALIWIFDSSLVTLDLSTPPSSDRKEFQRNTSLTMFFSSRLGWGALLRIAVITTSLLVTAPLLTQLLLSEDIEEVLNRQRGEIRVQLLTDVAREHSPKLDKLNELLHALRRNLTGELAGRGQSGLYGDGPVAKAIRDQINIYELKAKKVQQQMEQEIELIETSGAQELATRYGVAPLQNTFGNRRQIQHSLLKASDNQQYKTLELLARIFLTFIFIALVGLKVFQPRSVGIYLDEHLQDMYLRYLSGGLDHSIEEIEYADGVSPMTPYRFQDWVYGTYLVEENDDQRRSLSSKFKRTEDELKRSQAEIMRKIDPLKGKLAAFRKRELELILKEKSKMQEGQALKKRIDE
ncbi:MAG: hypothetical protein O7C72_06135, partial [Deltaproteobacteria bacterium]|nr:hypothetical protein [Deltaproteobacteria bacterium]